MTWQVAETDKLVDHFSLIIFITITIINTSTIATSSLRPLKYLPSENNVTPEKVNWRN